jgi:pimeloyl-ACP methyl ester carboxylesterase
MIKKVLYFHGGPGLNSNPEKHLLKPLYNRNNIDLKFFEEPSLKRPAGPIFKSENAYENYLVHAEKFLMEHFNGEQLDLVCHSFGSHICRHLGFKHSDKIRQIFFINSALDLPGTDKNVFNFVSNDYKNHNEFENAEKLKNYALKIGTTFDEFSIKGWLLVSENPRFMHYYWTDKSMMRDFVQYFSPPQYEIDPEAFILTRQSWFEPEVSETAIKVHTIFGLNDIVVNKDKEIEILKNNYSNVTVIFIEDCGHYPHIEKSDSVLRIIADKIF